MPDVIDPAVDEHSYAEPDVVRTGHLDLDLTIDFDSRTLAGSATLSLEWLDPGATRLLLDTSDLTIESVVAVGTDGADSDLAYELGEADPILGTRLTVHAPGRPAQVRVAYRTSPEASGLQWLEPSMTEGQRRPFMFSQSQQIHARSWVPLQDTPRVRLTYAAHVRAPGWAMVLMSADNDPQAVAGGEFTVRMPQPIPSYLLAIAAGDLAFAPVSDRSGVWAEPAMVERAASEFEDVEAMLQAAEGLYGPYRWDRYDLLVLPPSFPFGGMENPRLTFTTPTVVVGDRSLVSLVAHEIAHSWSGNLVTFANARHTWLNEGVTTYVERRVVEVVSGRDVADMLDVLERDELAVRYAGRVDPSLQRLAVRSGDLADPEDLPSATSYAKGSWFIQWLEQAFGRATFDEWLRGYFDHFAFQSITTEQFRGWLEVGLLEAHPGTVTVAQVDQWLTQPGVPDFAPQVHSNRLAAVDAALATWSRDGTLPAPAATDAWSTHEWMHFLVGLPARLRPEQLAQLDEAYRLTGTPNGEIAERWYPLTVRGDYPAAREPMADFLRRVGRMKLLTPTYAALAETPEGLAYARELLAQARPGYHPLTTRSVEKTLSVAGPAAGSAGID